MNVIDTTEGCRYCLMCRHICPVTRVTFNEATSPHGWALAIASVRRGLLDWDAETANLLYQCADCGACQAFCVTGQPLPQAIVAARAQVAAAGGAPAAVADVAAALTRWGNPYGPADAPTPHANPTMLLAGAVAWHRERAQLDAAQALLEHAGVAHGLLAAGRDTGYLAYTLGLHDLAASLARATADEIGQSGCRSVLVLEPEQAWLLREIYPALGAPLPDTVEVIELVDALARLLAEGQLRLQPLAGAHELAYHDPCHTPRRPDRADAPRRLLAALLGGAPAEGFWRAKRAASCGASGGLPWTQPALAGALARAAIADALGGARRTLVCDAPGCLAHLRANAGEQTAVRGLYELLAEHALSGER